VSRPKDVVTSVVQKSAPRRVTGAIVVGVAAAVALLIRRNSRKDWPTLGPPPGPPVGD